MAKPITLRSRGDTFLLLILPLAFIAILAAFLFGCGGEGHHDSLGVGPRQPALNAETNPQVAEVLAAPAPEGVEPALWDMLRDELARELVDKEISQPKSLNITWTAWTDGVGWRNDFMKADGNDDGEIGIDDLTPIVVNYGSTEGCSADYNRDGVVDIGDITPLARSFGLSCSGFIVELSSTSVDTGFSSAPIVGYSEYVKEDKQYHVYRVQCYPWAAPRLFVRVRALDNSGMEIGRSTFNVIVGGTFPSGPGPDIELAPWPEPTVTWSTAHLLPDGNQDGDVDWFDLGWLEAYSDTLVSEHSELQVADYNWDGKVDSSDIAFLAMNWEDGIAAFSIDISTTGADEGYESMGTLPYFSSLGFNESGFRYYEYPIFDPPVGVPYWVRVVPLAHNGTPGIPGAALYFAP
jgi:hypothetical protein